VLFVDICPQVKVVSVVFDNYGNAHLKSMEKYLQ